MNMDMQGEKDHRWMQLGKLELEIITVIMMQKRCHTDRQQIV
jgi:hypothetical protein